MKRWPVLFYLSLITFFGCKSDTNYPFFGYDYFGLTEGKFVEYDVMEIFHDVNLNPSHDTTFYTLRTVVGEKITDNEGRLANKIFRYKYDNYTGGLLDQRVWTAIIDQGKGEIIEENQRIIRMVFAVSNDKQWDVNVYNPLDEQQANYRDIHAEKIIGEFIFDSTVVVEYEDFLSLVDYERKYDTYAHNVGLVHRVDKNLTIANFDTLQIQYGTEIHYTLKDFGIE
jgi:hypothetical protein